VLLALCSLVASAGCGKDAGTAKAPSNCRRAVGSAVTLVARDVAWDASCLAAPTGTLHVRIDNRDPGVQHNLRITGNGVNTHTPLQGGPVIQSLTVNLPRPGRYTYVCDIHANMEGTLSVG
jgi:plastocyanin